MTVSYNFHSLYLVETSHRCRFGTFSFYSELDLGEVAGAFCAAELGLHICRMALIFFWKA